MGFNPLSEVEEDYLETFDREKEEKDNTVKVGYNSIRRFIPKKIYKVHYFTTQPP